MLTLYVLQAIVPLVGVAWLALASPRSAIGFWVQSIATALVLVAIGYTGIWMFPPWWTPFALGVLLSAAVMANMMGRQHQSHWPRGRSAWMVSAVFAAIGLCAANDARAAWAVATIPEVRSVDLASPLGPGTYLVANGGAGSSLNAHAAWLDQSIAAHKPWWGTGHAVDLIAIDAWGFRADAAMPSDPGGCLIFGKPVVAPCSGEIVAAVDGLPDMEVPQTDTNHLAGNHVILSCNGVHVLLAHFRKSSLVIRMGRQLATGETIAAVGNSGNSSEPHMHINAQEPGTADASFSGAPIPIRINGRNDRLIIHAQVGKP